MTHDSYTYYMDDFGTRTVCGSEVNISSRANEFSFSLGGIIVKKSDVSSLAADVKSFCRKWNIEHLHGHKIRTKKGSFGFLDNVKIKEKFLTVLELVILKSKIIVHGCVICRPGYRDRYQSKYADCSRWAMSKTAFDISVERAAKFARANNAKLTVVFEGSGKKEDKLFKKYFDDLKSTGTQFSPVTSARYSPLKATEMVETLDKIWSDSKRNPLLQIADLMVHPISQITLGNNNHAYDQLVEHKMLLDFHHADPLISIKYSCYDGKYALSSHIQKHTRDPEGSPEAVGIAPDPLE